MTQDEQREQMIQKVADLLRNSPFSFEFKVKKKPQGIKITYEVSQEEMDALIQAANPKNKQL